MSVKRLANLLSTAIKTAKSGGVAAAGIVSGNMVTINGRAYEYEIIVPIIVRDGQRVIAQVSAGDNKAYIIG